MTNKNTTKLVTEESQGKKNHSTKMPNNLLQQIEDHFKKKEIEQAFNLVEKGISLANDTHDYLALIQLYYCKGKISKAKGDFNTALTAYKNSCKYALELENTSFIINSLAHIARIYYAQSDFQNAISNYFELLQWTQKTGQPLAIANAALNLGIAFSTASVFDKAITFLIQATTIYESQNHLYGLSSAYNALANIFSNTQQIEKSILYHQKALEIRQQLKLDVECAKSLNNLGIAYQNQGNLSEAALNFQKAIQFANESSQVLSAAWSNLGSLSQEQNDYKAATDYFTKAFELRKQDNDLMGIAGSLYDLGYLHERKQVYKEALKYAEESLQISRETTKSDSLLENCLLLKRIHAQLGNHTTALQYANEAFEVREQIHNQQVSQTLLEKQIKYETEKKEQEIAFLNRENELRTTLFGELHHRVKNNLLVLYTMLESQGEKIEDAIAKAALKESENRVYAMYIIHEKLYLKKDDQLVNIYDYVHRLIPLLLHSFGFTSKKIQVNIQVANISLKANQAVYLCLIINELVINSLKYAYKDVASPKLDLILEEKAPNKLHLLLKDNGNAKEADFDKQNSFGMDLIEDLTEQLRATKSFKIDKGTSWQFDIPLGE